MGAVVRVMLTCAVLHYLGHPLTGWASTFLMGGAAMGSPPNSKYRPLYTKSVD